MDVTRTEALIARFTRDGWDITPNAYKYQFAGTYVMADTETGSVYICKGSPQVNLDLARRIAAYLEKLPGIGTVRVDPQMRAGDITVWFHCKDFTGTWSSV